MEPQPADSPPLDFGRSARPRKVIRTYTRRPRHRRRPVTPKEAVSESSFLTQEDAKANDPSHSHRPGDVPTPLSDAALFSLPENFSRIPSMELRRSKPPFRLYNTSSQSKQISSIRPVTPTIVRKRPRPPLPAITQAEGILNDPALERAMALERSSSQNDAERDAQLSKSLVNKGEQGRGAGARRSKNKSTTPVEGLEAYGHKAPNGSRKRSSNRSSTRESRRSSIDPEDFKFPPKTPTSADIPSWTPGSGFDGAKLDLAETEIFAGSLTRRTNHKTKTFSHFYSRAIFPRMLQLTTNFAPNISRTSTPIGRKKNTISEEGRSITLGPVLGTKDQNHAMHSRPESSVAASNARVVQNREDTSCVLGQEISNPKLYGQEASQATAGSSKFERGGWLKRKRHGHIPESSFDDGYFLQAFPAVNGGSISALLQDTLPKIPDIIVTSPTRSNAKGSMGDEQLFEGECAILFNAVAVESQELSIGDVDQPQAQVRASLDPMIHRNPLERIPPS